jgi:hypothetical protein
LEGIGHSRLHQAEPPAELARELGIAGKRGRLILPQIEVTARQRLEIRLRAWRTHGRTIAKGFLLRRNIRGSVSLPPPAKVLLCCAA